MRIVQPEVHIENQDWKAILRRIETKGRVCYKSEDRIDDSSAPYFVIGLFKRGHLSVLEHASVSVKFIVDRGVSHEIVRHRIAAYSQESTRYCNYGNNDNGVTVIEPFFWDKHSAFYGEWEIACRGAEKAYCELINHGSTPQEARSVLPNSLKTEIWATYNLREWLHFFTLRAAKTAHPQMRQVVIPLLLKFGELMPVLFEGLEYDKGFPLQHYGQVKVIEDEQI